MWLKFDKKTVFVFQNLHPCIIVLVWFVVVYNTSAFVTGKWFIFSLHVPHLLRWTVTNEKALHHYSFTYIRDSYKLLFKTRFLFSGIWQLTQLLMLFPEISESNDFCMFFLVVRWVKLYFYFYTSNVICALESFLTFF